MRTTFIVLLAVVSIACANTSALHAAGVVSVSYVPPGLSPGDTYQIAFVTEGVTPAVDPSISHYDSFVNAEAVSPGAITETWGIEWSAVAATFEEYDAAVNAGVSAPVYLLDGTLIATGELDFWDGDHASAISRNQYGDEKVTPVWTGMYDDGGAHFVLGDISLGWATSGYSASANGLWASNGYGMYTLQWSMYAISEELTVIPEPTTLSTSLMLTGLGTIVGFARRKRERSTVASQV